LRKFAVHSQQITANFRQLHGSFLAGSPCLDTPNFTTFHPDDLERLFEEHDHLFFEMLPAGKSRSVV
jgi:hypothetical protein